MPSTRTLIWIIAIVIVALAGALWFFLSSGGSGAVAEIKKRGTLVVAVRDDSSAFSKRNSEGDLVGFEPDLARNLADRLGVEVELQAVKPEDRVQILQDGKADIVLAGMTRRPGLSDLVRLVEPAYYAGGANILVRMGSGVNEWEELKDRKVCGVQGAAFNETVVNQFGARLVEHRDADEALKAFDTGECRALLSDESWLISLLVQPDYANYDMPLSHIEGHHWFAAVRPDTPHLGKFVERTVKDWHSSGKIVELERKWKMRPSTFATRMHGG